MVFQGYYFSFDGIPCSEYNLMLYNIGSSSEDGGFFVSSGSINEEVIARRYKSFYYGTVYDRQLEFNLTFGVKPELTVLNKPLDRYDMEVISSWLTGKDGYRWLEIEQPDMETIRFHCIITELKYLAFGSNSWAFTCKVKCDSPFGYTFPEQFTFNINQTVRIPFYNRSTYNGYYRPKMKFSSINSNSISINNVSDNNHKFILAGFPNNADLTIFVDSENGIIEDNYSSNLYNFFNFNFFRLIRGDNILEVTGDFTLEITCEFPVNIGG